MIKRLTIVLALVGAGAPAFAHEVGLSYGRYRAAGGTIDAELTFADRELAHLFPTLDADRDGRLLGAEVRSSSLAPGVLELTRVLAGGAPCVGSLGAARGVEADGVKLELRFACPGERALAVDLAALFARTTGGHRHLVTLLGEPQVELVAYKLAPSFGLLPGATPTAGIGHLFLVGIEHIAFGFDHLVFLFGLIIVGRRLRDLSGVITSFTVAHSLTLGLAVLGVVAPSPKLIEPLIALSIAYVGIENLVAKTPRHRFLLTFAFGLIHGFGFAGALGEVGVPSDRVPLALLLFNLGVEAGQLGILLLVMPVVLRLQARPVFVARGVPILSALVAAAGLVWFVDRVA